MYHHRNFRGAYTKTLTPSGDGDVAARIAVGLEEPKVDVDNKRSSNNSIEDTGHKFECEFMKFFGHIVNRY